MSLSSGRGRSSVSDAVGRANESWVSQEERAGKARRGEKVERSKMTPGATRHFARFAFSQGLTRGCAFNC